MTVARAALLRLFGPPKKEVAARVGLCQSDLSKVLAGRRVPNDQVKQRIATELGIPAESWDQGAV
jgi:transcriptional regulator with XRE-family HTH domain